MVRPRSERRGVVGLAAWAEAFAADVRLVFDNAMLYNADPTHVVHAAAERLRARFDALFATSS